MKVTTACNREYAALEAVETKRADQHPYKGDHMFTRMKHRQCYKDHQIDFQCARPQLDTLIHVNGKRQRDANPYHECD